MEAIDPDVLEALPDFRDRVTWFLRHRPNLVRNLFQLEETEGRRQLFSLLSPRQLRRVLAYMLDESEFLSPFGVRSLSRHHLDHPVHLDLDGERYSVEYEPGESRTRLFGGNSNWRGPVWFPLNYLIIESLQKYHHFFGDHFTVEMPTGSGRQATLDEVADELSRRLISLFLAGPDGRRPVNGGSDLMDFDPHWRELVTFSEYFHGDTGAGLGASHQTGWTALVAKLIRQAGR